MVKYRRAGKDKIEAQHPNMPELNRTYDTIKEDIDPDWLSLSTRVYDKTSKEIEESKAEDNRNKIIGMLVVLGIPAAIAILLTILF